MCLQFDPDRDGSPEAVGVSDMGCVFLLLVYCMSCDHQKTMQFLNGNFSEKGTFTYEETLVVEE